MQANPPVVPGPIQPSMPPAQSPIPPVQQPVQRPVNTELLRYNHNKKAHEVIN